MPADYVELQQLDDDDHLGHDGASVQKTPGVARSQVCSGLLPRLLLFVAVGLVAMVLIVFLAHSWLHMDLPHSLDDLQQLSKQLDALRASGWANTVRAWVVVILLYLWQQTYSVPGTVLLNLLAGHVYGVVLGTIGTCFLTACGSTLAFWAGGFLGEPLMQIAWCQKQIHALRTQMDKERGLGVFWWLLFARLFPFSPYWLINLGAPFLNVPLSPFFWSTFLGVLPYNVACTQAGQVLGQLTSTGDLLTPWLIVKLCLVSLVSLIPVVWGKALQARIADYVRASPSSPSHASV
ncbi:snare associated Golgi protein-domain-containing protein [Gongronella butleri]|nr:snare associated Golgi protein-domain-containing protein [Gongronella butleri]